MDFKIIWSRLAEGEDTLVSADDLIKFRSRVYRRLKGLGKGACGETILLHDGQIDEYFVCKKYAPYSEEYRQELFNNFKQEIKLLHQVYHPNVVRVFNYYLYPGSFHGYILMEFVEGQNIDQYVKEVPENINDIFLQAVDGFQHLEEFRIQRTLRRASA